MDSNKKFEVAKEIAQFYGEHVHNPEEGLNIEAIQDGMGQITSDIIETAHILGLCTSQKGALGVIVGASRCVNATIQELSSSPIDALVMKKMLERGDADLLEVIPEIELHRASALYAITRLEYIMNQAKVALGFTAEQVDRADAIYYEAMFDSYCTSKEEALEEIIAYKNILNGDTRNYTTYEVVHPHTKDTVWLIKRNGQVIEPFSKLKARGDEGLMVKELFEDEHNIKAAKGRQERKGKGGFMEFLQDMVEGLTEKMDVEESYFDGSDGFDHETLKTEEDDCDCPGCRTERRKKFEESQKGSDHDIDNVKEEGHEAPELVDEKKDE